MRLGARLAFAAIGLSWIAITTAMTAMATQEPQSVTRSEPFAHDRHVSSRWVDPSIPEVWRDCRGCHRFDEQNRTSSPQEECDKCHVGEGKLERAFAAGFERDLARYTTRTGEAFRHHTHAGLECRQCHSTERLYAHFDIRTGPGQCASCHEEGRLDRVAFAALRFFDPAAKAAAQQMGAEAYAQNLVEVFAGPTGGINTTPLPIGGDFDHGDHCGVQNGVLGSLLACADCHGNVETASATAIGTGDIPRDKCGSCHVADAAKTPAKTAVGGKTERRSLWSLGTFAHGDHFGFKKGVRKVGVCNAAAYDEIEKGCSACHTYQPEAPGRPGHDFPFVGGKSKHRYGDCIGCHDVPAWQTGETAAAPLHASTGGVGVGNGWSGCASCHVFGERDMARRRPMVEVQRRVERTFVFPANVHPDITAKGTARGEAAGRASLQDCKDCHRANIPELPTRLAKKPFRHDSHLRASPEPKDCLECHPSAALATTSAGLASEKMRTYSLAGCAKCHWGGAVTEMVVEGEAPATKLQRVEFPHGAHVQAAGQSCLECHALTDGRDISTKPEAQGCYQCHDHKSGGPTHEGLFDGRTGSCVRCHHEAAAVGSAPPVLAVPLTPLTPLTRGAERARTDPRYDVDQSVFAGFGEAQFHPLGMACSECHKARETKNASGRSVLEPIAYAGEDHVIVKIAGKVHSQAGAKQPAQCLRCHWKPVGLWDDAVRGGSGTAEEQAWRREPDGEAARRALGNDKVGYPGTERARG